MFVHHAQFAGNGQLSPLNQYASRHVNFSQDTSLSRSHTESRCCARLPLVQPRLESPGGCQWAALAPRMSATPSQPPDSADAPRPDPVPSAPAPRTTSLNCQRIYADMESFRSREKRRPSSFSADGDSHLPPDVRRATGVPCWTMKLALSHCRLRGPPGVS